MRAQDFTRPDSERGIALITTLLIMMLMSALLVGFTTVVMSDQRYRLIDRDRVRSFYAAHSGVEKLNLDLRNLFLANVSPTAAQIAALSQNPPAIPDVTFVSAGPAAYGVRSLPPELGCSNPCSTTISSGPFAGLIALKQVYRLDATARTVDGGETHLYRKVETVAIPVFQFGLFSDVDLSFHAGPNFNFGGRVHSNGNLFLAQGNGTTLTLPQKVTAVREIVRQRLANGVQIGVSGHTGNVSAATAPGAFRNLLATEGSVVDGPTSAENNAWPTISLSTYNGYLRDGTTGALPLNLPLLTTNGANVDLIKRGVANEDGTNPALLAERYFSKASVRILLSDTALDLTSLPGITGTPPVQLDGNWRTTPPNNGAPYGPVSATRPPIARSPGRVGLVGGSEPTVLTAVAAAGTTINVTNPAAPAGARDFLPAAFKVPSLAPGATEYFSLTVRSGANVYSLTCRNKASATQFTGCVTTSPPAATVNTGAGVVVVAALTNDTLVTSNLNANWASPWTSITVVDTAAFQPNTYTLTVTKAGQAGSPWTVHCGIKTQTTFANCIPEVAPGANVTAPAVVSADVPTTDGTFAVTQNTTATWQSSASAWLTWATITVGSTLAYSPNTFWVMNPNNTNVLVTCAGFQHTNQLIGCGNGGVDAALQAGATITTAARANAGTGVIGGFIKIERQDQNKVWTDVTMEMLNYGIADRNLSASGRACGDPTPNAIVRLQRLRDNDEPGAGTCSYVGSLVSSDYWPNVIFDPREGLYRDVGPGSTDLYLGGVMHYVKIDAANLARWFMGQGAYAAGTGTQSFSDNGFAVYFSDRRNNRNASNLETGEYGFEDIINPLSGPGTPNGVLDTPSAAGATDAGEDANANATLETYGEVPSYDGTYNTAPPGALAPLTTAARTTTLVRGPYALVNRAMIFRRALKLVNGDALGSILDPDYPGLPTVGLTIAAENPVYIQGNWNATATMMAGATGPDTDPHVGTSIAADALTLLSPNWNDLNSINFPYTPGSRTRSANSYYRFAVIAGKNRPFPRPAAAVPSPNDFGTDGGAHNFLRMLESGGTVNYRGSIATFFFSRQAVGVYKCCATVYGAPTRNFNFDADFLNPVRLPPLTPMFRDTNSLGFAQEVRPGK
jgi:hypothetical protein